MEIALIVNGTVVKTGFSVLQRVVLLCATLIAACTPPGNSSVEIPPASAVVAEAAAPSAAAAPVAPARRGGGPGFRSARLLDEHFAKHGREFGTIDKATYLSLAQVLRDAPLSNDVLEIARPDGTTSRFERSTGSFLAFNDDRTIRTFFKPNDGERYFRRQARRRGA